jgi:hypothetical protein
MGLNDSMIGANVRDAAARRSVIRVDKRNRAAP